MSAGLLPFRGYRREWLWADVLAGVTGCLVMIPSVVAYARLMGLPPQNGLYAALIPLAVYPFFTTSPQVVVGPDIAICLLLASAIGPLAGGVTSRAVSLAALVSILSGAILLLCSRAKLGKAADFLSKPVLVGYMTGAALILVSSQLGGLLGIPLTNNEFFPRMVEAAAKVRQTSVPTLVFGLGLLGLLIGLRRISRKIPAALVASVVAVAVAAVFRLEEHGVAVVGKFAGGLPAFSLPMAGWHDVHSVLPATIGVAFLAYTEGILLARAFAEKNNYEVDANKELAGLGMANFCNGFFQGFSVTGSQSRTMINDAAGGKTQVASLVSAGTLALFLLFLTPMLGKVPTVALAAILIYGGWTLVEFDAMKRIYRYYPSSAVVAALTTLGVLGAGVVQGILFGVVLSLVGLISRISRPPDAVLHEVPGHGFHDTGEKGETVPGLVVYRFYAPLLFSNCGYFSERVHGLIAAAGRVKWFLVDAQAITDIDVTAVEMLHALHRDLSQKGVSLKMAHANRPLRELLERTGLETEIGAQSFFASVHECVEAFKGGAGKGTEDG